MTRYDLFKQLKQLCEMTQTGEYQYNKIIQAGDIEACDYGVGFFDLSIYYTYDEFDENKPHIVRTWLGNIDDECVGSWNFFDSKEDAIKLLNKLVEFFKDMIKFPTLEELNKELREIGVYIYFE